MESIPVFVICYNNGWLVENTIAQLQPFARDFVVIDNASDEPSTLASLKKLALRPHVSIWTMPKNWGPRCIYRPLVWNAMPNYFALTDPDLEYPDTLPEDFIERLKRLNDSAKFYKVGPALDIEGPPEIFQCYPLVAGQAQFWEPRCRLETLPGAPPVYEASIDTTFAVYSKRNYIGNVFAPSARVAGRFTVKHRPWYKAFWEENASRLQATYEGAVYSTTGAMASKTHLDIPTYAVRPWTSRDPRPPDPRSPDQRRRPWNPG